jgi:hypothetical protein
MLSSAARGVLFFACLFPVFTAVAPQVRAMETWEMDIQRNYPILQNEYEITGTLIGWGEIANKAEVHKNSLPVISGIKYALTFDLEQPNWWNEYHVTIPLPSTQINDLRLFRYVPEQGGFELVREQWSVQPKNDAIEADFTNGGSFAVMSLSEWKKHQ